MDPARQGITHVNQSLSLLLNNAPAVRYQIDLKLSPWLGK